MDTFALAHEQQPYVSTVSGRQLTFIDDEDLGTQPPGSGLAILLDLARKLLVVFRSQADASERVYGYSTDVTGRDT